MRSGCSYLAPHNPKHIRTDLEDIRSIGCDDVLLAFQENDFVYMTGKLTQTPSIAREVGLRSIAIFWGGLNEFGGGRSSQILLEHPEAHQVMADGSWYPGGCYNNPICMGRIIEIVDFVAQCGFDGFFVDEPSPMNCVCDSCQRLFRKWYGEDLMRASEEFVTGFRRRCVVHYIEQLTSHIKSHHPQLETMCCMMPEDRAMWEDVAAIEGLDCLGTDVYWANDDRDIEEMRPLVRDMAQLCRNHGKVHQEWFQCWGIEAGNEKRAADQGHILIEEKPDAIYTWAYNGQLGTSESCANPELAWRLASEVLRAAKEC